MSPPAEPVRIPAAGLPVDRRIALWLGLLCWVGVGVITLLVLTGRSWGLDEALLLSPHRPARGPSGVSPPGMEMVRDITALGGVLVRNLLAIGTAMTLLFLHRRREALWLVLTVAGGWLFNSALKAVIGRERPDLVPHLVEATGPSFPSGHSFNSAVVFLAIALAIAPLLHRRAARPGTIFIALAISVAVAWSRVWLGVHYPTDVAAGWLGGVGWTFLAATLLHRPTTMPDKAAAGQPGGSP